ncbi:MAG: protoporphyrinogen oxidase HemJ [Pseudomonadales bacterium]|nr:protoporphyrinogen oxidase HemJ [Pseudomonadales bacterium]
MTFIWIKALHLIAMVCWFAAIFYLPRLFVYHAMTDDHAGNERFKIMERKLFRGIATPSAIVTAFLGLWMIHLNPEYYLAAKWLHLKLGLVSLLVFYHASCAYFIRLFATNQNNYSHKFYRIYNEIPVFLLVGIIILAVVKPV